MRRRWKKDRKLTGLKQAVLGISLAVVSAAAAIPAHAYYAARTGSAVNGMDVSRLVLVSFDGNGGAGEMPDAAIPYGQGRRVPANTYTKAGYTFTGWNREADGSGAGIADRGSIDTLSFTGTELSLYAAWRPNSYTVSFKANGGSGAAMADIGLAYGEEREAPACTYVYTDHLFLGWNTKADGSGTQIPAGGRILNLTAQDQGSITLWAQWEDESEPLIETGWDKALTMDADGNGTADRLELRPGSTYVKDPSLKNHTDRAVYGYILVSVPAVGAKKEGDTAFRVYDAVTLHTDRNWTLVRQEVSSTVSGRSKYLYRYDTVLEAYGSQTRNPYHSLRRADRSTDLMTGFTVGGFTECSAIDDAVSVTGVFIEATAGTAEADQMAMDALAAQGLL